MVLGPILPFRLRVAQATPGSAAAISGVWVQSPLLGSIAGQNYLGRIVVEVFDSGGKVALVAADRRFVGRAAAAVLAAKSFLPEVVPWPKGPVTGAVASDGAYRGRFVIELWTTTTNVAAATSEYTVGGLVQRAAEALSALERP